jgi:DNA primase
MWAELENLKRQFPLLDYLRQHNWVPRQLGLQQEFVGLCPFHAESHPSFYVNAAKNLFYCHGCGRGGDLIRFVQLYFDLPFRQAVACLKQELGFVPASPGDLLEQAAAFYQLELPRHSEALEYLDQRGLRNPDLIQRLGIGYAPGGNLRRYLTVLGHRFELLLELGLVNREGRDTLYKRVVFPCRTALGSQGLTANLYGRSISAAPPHRFLPLPKGGLYAWDSVRDCPTVILVEGLFDLAVLWQAGFTNTTCGFGTLLTPAQFAQLCDRCARQVLIVFDNDASHAGQNAAQALARRLRAAGLTARVVALPDGHDPNSYFTAGATAADFTNCLDQAPEVQP